MVCNGFGQQMKAGISVIVTDYFVFIHLHKSGGSFVNRFLQKFEPSTSGIGYHLPYSEVPDDFRHLPVFGCVRNPWSFYVSWYSFQAGMENPNPLFMVVSENQRLGFEGTIKNLLTLSESSDRIDLLASQLPKHFGSRGQNLTRNCVSNLLGKNIGFYTFLFQRMFAECDKPVVARMESLREQMLKLLPGLGRPLSIDEENYIRDSRKTNVTAHKQHCDYYDHELRDLVAEKESEIIERFGYTFSGDD